MTPWIMDNLYLIAGGILMATIGLGAVVGIFFAADDILSKFRWYRDFVYGPGVERYETSAESFLAKSLIVVGIINLVMPIIVVYGYLYYSNTTWSTLVKIKSGG